MGAKSKGRYTHLCYQGSDAIPMLFFSIITSTFIYIFALHNYFANIRGTGQKILKIYLWKTNENSRDRVRFIFWGVNNLSE
jgi:hypothetical protein